MSTASAQDRLRAERKSWTCALRNFAGAHGTGILIGPDLVLTNFHVVKPLYDALRNTLDSDAPDAPVAQFDFFDNGPTTQVRLHHSWLDAFSYYSNSDLSERGEIQPDSLDYAVIRLGQRIGEIPLPPGHRAGWPDAAPATRGWLRLPDSPTELDMAVRESDPILVYHHPTDRGAGRVDTVMPLQESRGRVLAMADNRLRVLHNAETDNGSSGAICYDRNLIPIALHHAGDRGWPLSQNRPGVRAVPLHLVTDHLYRTKRALFDQNRSTPAAEFIDVEFGHDEVAEREKILRRRQEAATVLLDREEEERHIRYARKVHKGLVHAITGRRIDSPDSLITRLRLAGLACDGIAHDRVEVLVSNLLVNGLGEQGWKKIPVPADVRSPAKGAADRIVFEIGERTSPHFNSAVVIERSVQGLDLVREEAIIAEVVQRCTALARERNIQVFFVYVDDSPSPRSRLRSKLARLWDPDGPRPGYGHCGGLEDVKFDQLDTWRDALATAFEIDSIALEGDIARIFARKSRLPIQQVEHQLRPVIQKHCRNVRHTV
jgi:hypothetical protein